MDKELLKDARFSINSPLVGTFYRSYTEDADSSVALVREGRSIKKGDTVCLIKAMDLMNEIESEYDGVIENVLVPDGNEVEYDAPLFIVVPIQT